MVKVSALVAGWAIGFGAALVQAFFRVIPPPAWGVCGVGHPSDLVGWITNHLFGTVFILHPASVAFPVLTFVGIVIGAMAAAIQHRELKLAVGSVKDPIFAFILGFLVINFGLIWGACSIRTVIMLAYGNLAAVVVLAAIILGVLFACKYIRWRVKK